MRRRASPSGGGRADRFRGAGRRSLPSWADGLVLENDDGSRSRPASRHRDWRGHGLSRNRASDQEGLRPTQTGPAIVDAATRGIDAGQGRVGRRAIPIGFEYRESRADPARRSWKRPGRAESGPAARGGIGIRRPARSGAALAVPMGCDVRQTAIRPAWNAAALLRAERTTRMCPGMMAAR